MESMVVPTTQPMPAHSWCPTSSTMRCTDLEADDEVEEEDHVDDAVDDGLLDADDEEHGGAHQDPVLAAHVPHPMT